MKYLIRILLASLLITPITVSAAFFASEEDISSSSNINDDAYIAGRRVTIQHSVAGDLFVAGNNVQILNSVNGDAIAFAQTIVVKGGITDDIIVAGENVTIDSQADDIIVAGENVLLTKETISSGDAYLAGRYVEISGNIAGNVKVAGNKVVIASNAVIKGDLTTYGTQNPEIKAGAIIEGKTSHHFRKTGMEKRSFVILGWVKNIFSWFAIALLLAYSLPKLVKRTTKNIFNNFWKSLGIGFLVLMLFLPITILLTTTMIGLPIALFVIFATAILIIASLAYTNIIVGSWIGRKVLKQKNTVVNWQYILLGTVVLISLKMIPIIGGFTFLLLLILSIGSLALTTLKTLR